MCRGRNQRRVYCNHIGFGKEISHTHHLNTHCGSDLCRDERIVGNDRHLQCLGTFGHFAPDSSKPNHAKHFAVHLVAHEL